MSNRSGARATAMGLVLVVFVVVLLPSTAGAAGRASTGKVTSMTSAKWAVVATDQGVAPTTGQFAVNWSVNKGTAYNFMDAVNVGTVAVAGQTYTFTTVPTQNGNQKIPTITLDACIGATWVAATNTCAGTITRMGSAISGSFAATVPLATNSRLSVRVVSDGPPGASFLTTINVSVTRAQVRAGAVTNG